MSNIKVSVKKNTLKVIVLTKAQVVKTKSKTALTTTI